MLKTYDLSRCSALDLGQTCVVFFRKRFLISMLIQLLLLAVSLYQRYKKCARLCWDSFYDYSYQTWWDC